ncbi:MAG: nucleotidyltransferase [Pyrinomonadaceae bacterium]
MELELPQDFKELFRSLNAKGVEYLLIGGYAVIIHGYVRNTNDIDIAVSNDSENIARCLEALVDFGFGGPELKKALTSTKKNVVRMGVEPMKIEILNYLNGVDFNVAYSRRLNTTIEDINVNVISLGDLIANKEDVGRLQDLLDVEKLKERNY